MATVQKITPCLWFDHEAEEAAVYYVGIFRNSRIVHVSRYGEGGQEVHRRPPGSVMVVLFELEGQSFTALNGGPAFNFNEAVSLQVNCRTQEEIDYYWEKLAAGGDPRAQQCGWLKDRYGVSWQVIPDSIDEFFGTEETPGSRRAMEVMMNMKKIDLGEMRRAHDEGSRAAGRT